MSPEVSARRRFPRASLAVLVIAVLVTYLLPRAVRSAVPDVTDSPNLALLLLGFVFAGYGSSFMFFYAAVRERALAPVAVTAVTALLAAAPPWFVTAGLFRRFALASDAWFWVYSAAFGFSVVFVSPLAHRHAAGARAAWFAATVVAGLAIAVVSIFAIMIARSA